MIKNKVECVLAVKTMRSKLAATAILKYWI